jgi:tungstate transport system substrate-binding protein
MRTTFTHANRSRIGGGGGAIAAAVIAMAFLGLGALTLLGAACGDDTAAGPDTTTLILATTTSVKDSGLLDEALLPAFTSKYPDLEVKTVAVGSGEAIAMGEAGDADVLFVHSPADEEEFMASGSGTLRLPVAYNYYKVVGPAADPAGIAAAASAEDAFARVAQSGAPFVSRGDASGTNKKELKLWNAAGLTGAPEEEPVGDWYLKTGQGMGETLQVASEKQAYTLTDYATFLSMGDAVDLEVLFGESDDLKNQYSVIVVSQAEHPTVNSSGAELWAAFVTSPDGQKLIGDFGQEKYGEQLFVPDAGILGTGQ